MTSFLEDLVSEALDNYNRDIRLYQRINHGVSAELLKKVNWGKIERIHEYNSSPEDSSNLFFEGLCKRATENICNHNVKLTAFCEA